MTIGVVVVTLDRAIRWASEAVTTAGHQLLVVVNGGATAHRFNAANGARVVELGSNVGYAAAANVGLQELITQCDAVIVLNDDADWDPVAIDNLGRLALSSRSFVAPIELDNRGLVRRSWWSMPGLRTVVLDLAPIAWRGRKRLYFDREELGQIARDGRILVPYIPGFCVAGSSRDWVKVGGWDERFPFYYEDVALGAKAQSLGIPSFIATGIALRHESGATTARLQEHRVRALLCRGLLDYLTLYGRPGMTLTLVERYMTLSMLCWAVRRRSLDHLRAWHEVRQLVGNSTTMKWLTCAGGIP